MVNDKIEKILEKLGRISRGASLLEQLNREVLNEIAALTATDHENLARLFFHVDVAHDQFKDSKKLIDNTHDVLSRDKIPDAMRQAKVKNFALSDIGRRVQLGRRWSATVVDGKRSEAFQWLRDNNLGDLITETVNASSLAATAKNLVETENKELPDDLFRLGTLTYTSLVKL